MTLNKGKPSEIADQSLQWALAGWGGLNNPGFPGIQSTKEKCQVLRDHPHIPEGHPLEAKWAYGEKKPWGRGTSYDYTYIQSD